MSSTDFRLSDHTIGCFIQSVQAALMSGTDISDLMRLIRLTPSSTDPLVLEPTASYIDTFNLTMDQMMERVQAIADDDDLLRAQLLTTEANQAG